MIKKHHNINYLISRLKQIVFQYKNPDAPWLTPLSIELLGQLIKKKDRGLEFGSGRSTLWLVKRCRNLKSVEHNKNWFEWVKNKLIEVKNVDYYFGTLDDLDKPKSDYLSIINFSELESLDFVLNDGKLRDLVALEAINKLKSGGLLIIDNAERYLPNSFNIPESIGEDFNKVRENWKIFTELTQDWRRIWSCDGVSSTLIMFKP